MRQRRVSPEQWNGLKNKPRLAYFNITAAIASLGLWLAGWLVDWAAGGIQQERVFFVAGPGATELLGQVSVSRNFAPDINRGRSHAGYESSFRQSVFHRSLQLSFSPDGRRLDADLDSFNPNKLPFGFLSHAIEVFGHKLGKLNGAKGTNPYNVAYRSSWECK